jgi:hypothetical protein
MQDAARRALS